jgi:hypothetical protein
VLSSAHFEDEHTVEPVSGRGVLQRGQSVGRDVSLDGGGGGGAPGPGASVMSAAAVALVVGAAAVAVVVGGGAAAVAAPHSPQNFPFIRWPHMWQADVVCTTSLATATTCPTAASSSGMGGLLAVRLFRKGGNAVGGGNLPVRRMGGDVCCGGWLSGDLDVKSGGGRLVVSF